MYKFALKEIEEIEGRISFFKLIKDDVCEFDEFIEQCRLDGGLESEITQLQTRMQFVADLKTLPEQKFRDITPKNDAHKEYEIKTKHLRVYLFHDKSNGRVIVCGGKKTTQKKDIGHFRNIKKTYFKQN